MHPPIASAGTNKDHAVTTPDAARSKPNTPASLMAEITEIQRLAMEKGDLATVLAAIELRGRRLGMWREDPAGASLSSSFPHRTVLGG